VLNRVRVCNVFALVACVAMTRSVRRSTKWSSRRAAWCTSGGGSASGGMQCAGIACLEELGS
jgi:hypothetical protein